MKLTVYMAQTINGYIAKFDDDTPWSDDSWGSYYSIAGNISAMIVGRRTYELIEQDRSEWDKICNPFVIVLSKTDMKLREGFACAKTPRLAMDILTDIGLDSALIAGGAMTNTAFISAGLVNELIIDVESLMFSKGLNYINEVTNMSDIRLKLKSAHKISDNLAQLRYSVLND